MEDLTTKVIKQLRNCTVLECKQCPFRDFRDTGGFNCVDKLLCVAANELEFLYLKLAKFEREETK